MEEVQNPGDRDFNPFDDEHCSHSLRLGSQLLGALSTKICLWNDCTAIGGDVWTPPPTSWDRIQPAGLPRVAAPQAVDRKGGALEGTMTLNGRHCITRTRGVELATGRCEGTNEPLVPPNGQHQNPHNNRLRHGVDPVENRKHAFTHPNVLAFADICAGQRPIDCSMH